MECNKDEAARAKEIAERKFSEREYADAKKFALKALSLFPLLEGLPQLLTILDIYISAENKINGEMNWYGILNVYPYADEETVRKQYRKLALALHPDKNKSPGAEGAFKLVSEAWSLLSDKVKRLAYNQNRGLEGFQHNAPNHARTQSQAPSSNGKHNLNKNATSSMRTGNNDSRAHPHPPSVPPPHSRAHPQAGTFWTICSKCKTHYEYLRTYMNQTLLCPNCKQAFVAIEKGPPPNVFKSSRQYHQKSSRQHPNVGRNHPLNPGRTGAVSQNLQSSDPLGISSFSSTNFQGPHKRMAGFVRKDGSSSVAAANVNQLSSETRRECEGLSSIAAWERSHMHKRSDGDFSNAKKPMKKMRTDDMHMYNTNHMTVKDYSTRELSLPELRNMLIGKAQTEIRKKLREWRSMTEAKITNKDKGSKRRKSAFNDKTTDPDKGSTTNGNRHVDSDSSTVKSDDTEKEKPDYVTINVPDSDFHNFDLDRTESSFAKDQVWAAYDDDDGMPRYYARIHKVISTKPFRMRISWLNSRSNSELGQIDWVGSGFYKTCGDFRTGKHETSESLNSFSHKVRWTKGTRGIVRIFPGKGEVWALYRNWSPDWNENTPDEVIHKYDMVEVLEDFNEEEGVLVTPLVKVDGFRTVFRRQSDAQARKIPKVEMFRLSHQVPNYLLTGQEAHNAPKDCRELDPAATPVDLLQTTAEVNIGKSKEDTLPGSPEKHASGNGDNALKHILDEDVKQVKHDR